MAVTENEFDIEAFAVAVRKVTRPPPPPPGVEIPAEGEYGLIVYCIECGEKSGTFLIITHRRECQYWRSQMTPEVRYYDEALQNWNLISYTGPDTTVGMFEPAVSIRAGTIGSFGAAPCVIVGVRNEETGETHLVHLDACTGDPMLRMLMRALPRGPLLSVYLCGGDNCSAEQQVRILEAFEASGLNIVYRLIHLNDWDSNQLTIDAATGQYSMGGWDFGGTGISSMGRMSFWDKVFSTEGLDFRGSMRMWSYESAYDREAREMMQSRIQTRKMMRAQKLMVRDSKKQKPRKIRLRIKSKRCAPRQRQNYRR
jgi:hypothetical protein